MTPMRSAPGAEAGLRAGRVVFVILLALAALGVIAMLSNRRIPCHEISDPELRRQCEIGRKVRDLGKRPRRWP